MKQKDVALIIVIAVISGIISVFISKAIITPPKNRQEKVEVVEAFSTDFPKPDTKYFNSAAIDPTQIITIGKDTNTKPFNGINR